MKLPKIIRRLLMILVVGLILGLLVFHFFAPYLIIKPLRKTSVYQPKDYRLNGLRMEVRTKDSLLLQAYYVRSKYAKDKAIVVLLHGIGSCKEHLLGRSEYLAERGYASIAIDCRAHGKSEGDYCTFGYFEKSDISTILDDVQILDSISPIGVWGSSLGGAIALQAMEHDDRIQFGIVQSTFTELEEVVYAYQKRYFGGVGSRWLSNYALWRAGKIATFEPELVSPLRAAQTITRPVLILHGTADHRIPIEHGQTLFQQLKTTDKFFIPIQGGAHSNLASTNETTYFSAIEDFLNRFGKG